MRFKNLILPLLISSTMFAFNLNNEVSINEDGLTLEFGVDTEFKDNLVGKMTHEKIIECKPKLKGVSKYKQESIVFYTKDLHAGTKYTCRAGNGKSEFQTEDFGVRYVEKLKDDSYIISFNDDINATKLYNNLVIEGVKFSIKHASKTDVFVNLDKNISDLNLKITKGFESLYGAKTTNDFTYSFNAQDEKNTPEFEDNEKAKTLELSTPVFASFDNGKIGIKFYLANWLDTQALKKFVKINGINNFKISEPEYIGYKETENSRFFYEFSITSDEFKPQTEYDITILPGFGDKYYLVRDEQNFNVKLGDFAPFANFINDLPYISSVGQIGIKSANVANLKVVVEKLIDENYRYFLNFGSQNNLKGFSKEVASKNYELGGALNEILEHKISLDFADGGDGVYLISLYYDKDKSVKKVVYLSDIAINAKISKDELFIFANRIGENTMLANANVKIYNLKNEEIAVGATNDEGIYKFNKKDIYKDVSSVVVSLAKEQNFLIIKQDENLNENGYYQTSDKNDTINAYVYFASRLIRPNDSIKGIIYLKDDNFKPLKNMPVKLKISDPQGKKISEFAINSNDFGVVSFDENLTSNLTGAFSFDVIYASKIITIERFFVESFIPARIKNEIVLPKDKFRNKEILIAELQSSYLFGAPAENLSANAEINILNKEYKNDKYKEFSFKNSTQNLISYKSLFNEFVLDKNGLSKQPFVISLPQNSASALDAFLTFNVNDDGKNVSTTKKFEIFPFDTIVGIKTNKNFIEPNEKILIDTILLDTKEFKEQKMPLKFEIKRLVWQYNVDEHGYLKWFEELESIDTMIKNSAFEYSFAQSGEYTIIVTNPINGVSASTDITVSGYNYSTLVPTKELSKAQIKLNSKSYKKGDTISADISSAIKEGLALVTLEENGVLAYKLIHIKNHSANAKFELTNDFNGAYVSASIYRLADKANIAYRTYAKVYAKADTSQKEFETKILSQNTAKNNQSINIDIKTAPNADVTIFAVDLGILNLASQETPKPLNFFMKQINDGVFDYDIYNKLTSYVVPGKMLNFGSDAALMAMDTKIKKHESPVNDKNIETFVRMFRKKSDENGSVSYNLEIPELNSAIRVDVISVNNDKIGTATQTISVKDDVIIKPSMLVYMSKNDKIRAILRLINTTQKEKMLSLETISSKNLDINLSKTSISLKPLQSVSIDMDILAKELGNAEFKILATDENGEVFVSKRKLDVINPYPKSTYAKSFSFNKEMNFSLPKGYKDIKIDASASILSLVAAMSNNLISYPYGCAEQRSSKLLAMLNARPTKKSDQEDRIRFIKNGIKDLEKMQKSSGEFGYWDEMSYVNIFASIYAADVLFDLEKSGFKIDKNTRSRIIQGLNNLQTQNYMQSLYKVYVLAKYGELDRSVLNWLYDSKIYENSVLARYLMASSLKILGLEDEAKAVIDEKKIAKTPMKKELENFSSKLRDDSFILYLHAKYFDKNSYSNELAKNIITMTNSVASTQERAFVLRALNEYFKDQSNTNFKLIFDDKEQIFTKPEIINIAPQNGSFRIIPSSLMFVSITSDAYIPLKVKHKKESKNLNIYRTFLDKNGEEISLNSLKINDIIYSKVEISSKNRIDIGVINEITSACFEVVNENMTNIYRPQELKNSINLEYQTIKDDRVISFFSINAAESKTMFTPYRVVLSGKCNLPAISVENMYNETQNDYDLSQKTFTIK